MCERVQTVHARRFPFRLAIISPSGQSAATAASNFEIGSSILQFAGAFSVSEQSARQNRPVRQRRDINDVQHRVVDP
jgi:hypothetical protein